MTDGLVVLGSFVGAAAAVGGAVGLLWRRFRGLARLIDDLLGEPARPGVPASPGVMERLATHDQTLTYLAGQVQQLQGQVGTLIGIGVLPGPKTGGGRRD